MYRKRGGKCTPSSFIPADVIPNRREAAVRNLLVVPLYPFIAGFAENIRRARGIPFGLLFPAISAAFLGDLRV